MGLFKFLFPSKKDGRAAYTPPVKPCPRCGHSAEGHSELERFVKKKCKGHYGVEAVYEEGLLRRRNLYRPCECVTTQGQLFEHYNVLHALRMGSGL
jgi:hypothetical protein